MPMFEFRCNQCGKEFDKLVSQEGRKNVTCPECASADIRQKLSPFGTASRTISPGGSPDFPLPPSCAGCGNAGSCGMAGV
ncbi:MAG: zinc ribbon domain-containing protein [Syntrophomonadaceae bacterium]|nr:zinc ribbon domain-containing protein [Syntrophomonadaceae bacterium]